MSPQPLRDRIELSCLGQIGREHLNRHAMCLAQLFGQYIKAVGGPGDEYKIVAAGREAACINGTDATGGTSNESGCHILSLLVSAV
ncbi:hypothetical protein PSEUDO8Z_160281 [Pseudomonas sp. 8Z]|nr:hypothetical protein PSEUDO8Z_160281 [Pseudomonas sp. 8Z]